MEGGGSGGEWEGSGGERDRRAPSACANAHKTQRQHRNTCVKTSEDAERVPPIHLPHALNSTF